MADCQAFIALASACAQSHMHLYELELRGVDKSSPEYVEILAYCNKNLPKLEARIQKLKEYLG
ncbi:MAG: hypothetical protein ACTHJ2_09565 [Candidatus Nitrosocosmicus sp.]